MNPAVFASVADAVRSAGGMLTPAVFRALHRLCAEYGDAAAAIAPEYGRLEYLLNVAPVEAGAAPVVPDADTLAAARSAEAPAFARWFALADIEAGPAVLPARWLAHAVGLRHRVVHVFIEPAGRPDCAYVQFRSLDKPNAPASFDVAVGGHVSGTESLDATVAAEVAEELGLDPKRDLANLAYLGAYDYEGRGTDGENANLEHRAVYRAEIAPAALANVRFHDGEVAALCLFAVAELERLLVQRPERCASGLLESYALYRAATASAL